jgi:cytochrome o ubiquinol oxidase subunit 2
VNFVQFPKNTPVNFELTADAPMNSFWIPSLSGQIYAMTGMVTKLHMMASNAGDYPGSAAEISGKGFSTMRFTARSSTKEDFDTWVKEAKNSSYVLDQKEYERLSTPSEDAPVTVYGVYENNLYNRIVSKFNTQTHGM